jgi:hypothetical protein
MRNFTKIVLSLALLFVCLGGVKAEWHTIFTKSYASYNEGDALPYGTLNPPTGVNISMKAGYLQIENPARQTNNYDVQPIVASGFSVTEGNTYRVRVTLSASINGSAVNGSAVVNLGTWSNNAYNGFDFTVGESFNTYTIEFSTPADYTDSDVHILFQCGHFEGTVKIQQVEIQEQAVADNPDVNHVLEINNTTAGEHDWDRQAIYTLATPMVKDAQYILRATVRAETAGNIQLVCDDGSTSEEKNYSGPIAISTSFQNVEWWFNANYANQKFKIFLGGFEGKVYIDNVSLIKTSDSSEQVYNGNFALNSLAGWSVSHGSDQTMTRSVDDMKSAIHISDARFISYSNPVAVSLGGVTGYAAKYQDGKIVLTAVTQVPANTGVIIEANEGDYELTTIDSAPALANNQLRVSNGNTTSDGTHYFALGKKDDKVGFMKVRNTVVIPKGKAYLYLETPPLARDFIGFGEEDVTAIESVKATTVAHDNYFNIAGQRVAQPTKGLYIVNGKKVIIK